MPAAGWDAHRASGGGSVYFVEDREPPLVDSERERRARLKAALRRAFIEGAEEDSRRRLGRGLTAEELERVLRHYPGNAEPPRDERL